MRSLLKEGRLPSQMHHRFHHNSIHLWGWTWRIYHCTSQWHSTTNTWTCSGTAQCRMMSHTVWSVRILSHAQYTQWHVDGHNSKRLNYIQDLYTEYTLSPHLQANFSGRESTLMRLASFFSSQTTPQCPSCDVQSGASWSVREAAMTESSAGQPWILATRGRAWLMAITCSTWWTMCSQVTSFSDQYDK